MKIQKYFLLSILLALIVNYSALAQGAGEPFHPMTAPGATGIATSGHILVWENPTGTVYNEVYFSSDSSLVASLDTTARILNGYPSTTSNSLDFSTIVLLDYYTEYYWRVVEHDSTDFTAGPIWYFITRINPSWQPFLFDDFSGGSQNWIITNDGGTCVWNTVELFTRGYTLPNTASGNVFSADADDCGSGTTTISTATLSSMISFEGFLGITLEWDNDWRTIDAGDEAYAEASSDGGNSWEIIWSRIGFDERDSHEFADFYSSNTDSILVRFRTIQPGWDWWWAIDNVSVTLWGVLSAAFPPNYLSAFSDTSEQRVTMNWDPGSSPDPISGYRLQRKDSLPTDSTEYVTIIDTDANTFSYMDYNVQLNHNYTYRIATLSGPGPGTSIWGNEATAYVPEVIPVELITFTASVAGNDVHLNWSTATELNNSGFDILRFAQNDDNTWQKIGFIPGYGTTTEPQFYSFKEESVATGKFQYRLKQIDYDGTFEYSDIVEVEVGQPTEFSLEQNYPNPFNPSTKIKFSIPTSPLNPSPYQGEGNRERFITLIVYDVLGNEIATLTNEEKPAGSYEVEFNGKDLPSGIYFYQLKVGSVIQTKKMVLLR